jgi:hypothetical protein
VNSPVPGVEVSASAISGCNEFSRFIEIRDELWAGFAEQDLDSIYELGGRFDRSDSSLEGDSWRDSGSASQPKSAGGRAVIAIACCQ